MLGFRALNAFKDNSGQVAVIFALSIVPMLTLLAMAIDFQRTTAVKSQILHEMDAIALRGARHIMAGKSANEVRAILQEDINNRVITIGDTFCKSPEVGFSNRNREIKIDILCSTNTMLGPPAGPDNIMFKVSTVSTWDVGLLDVAFVFDISGSMNSNNRINSLKNAANDALDVLLPAEDATANDGVRIAMVAYDDMVNAGEKFEQVTGLAKKRTYHAVDAWRKQRKIGEETYTKRVCKWEGRTCSKRNEKGNCTKWTGGTRKCRDEQRKRDIKEFYGPTQYRNIKKTLNTSCVWERPGDEAFSDAAPTDSAGNQPRVTQPIRNIYDATTPIYNASEINGNPHAYMAAPYAYMWRDRPDHKDGFRTSSPGCSNIQPLGLTRDRSVLEKYIRDLKTRGGTAGHQGLAWAWYLISENWDGIFTGDAVPNSYDEAEGSKAIILMSDGEFIDEKFKNELGTSDQQARQLCASIKEQGEVQIYTVAFQAPSKGIAVLEYCASSPSQAFTADDENELRDAYNAIAGSLSELRIKQ
ncbi:MAG: TadE/TadG family type IV pilus assembly protein [Pseudomonadota bacterium]